MRTMYAGCKNSYQIPWYKAKGEPLSELFALEWNEENFERIYLTDTIKTLLEKDQLYVYSYPAEQDPICVQDIVCIGKDRMIGKITSLDFNGISLEITDLLIDEYIHNLSYSNLLRVSGVYAINREMGSIKLLNIFLGTIDKNNKLKYI